jgi:PAS domain S-box-containing protein
LKTTTARGRAGTVDLLVEAGEVLATSLDPNTTMGQIAGLMVPAFADLCVIDLLGEDGSIREVAVAAADPELARGLAQMRSTYPLSPEGAHPVARVIRSGEPVRLANMTTPMLSSFAESSEHAEFMVQHEYRSALVAPLVARGRTLGAVSALRLGAGEPFSEEDEELTCELARRAALAIDNAHLYADLRRIERRLEAILSNLAEAVTVVDERGETIFANQAAAKLLGVDAPSELVNTVPGSIMARFLVLDEQGRELDLDAMPGRRLFRGEAGEPLLVRNIVRATGEERWLIVRSSPIADHETGRMIYAVNVFEDITGVKRVQLAEGFMAEASRVLASSMDYAETLKRVARLAVPRIADWCVVNVLDEQGQIERVAVHHSDPRRLAVAEQLGRDYPLMPGAGSGVPEVIRTGESRIFTDIQPQALVAHARDEHHRELLLAINPSAVIIVPMIGAAGPVGAITLATSESLRRLSDVDVALAERLARRAGTAVEYARQYTARTQIARALQNALLPASLPEIPGVDIEAIYSPAGELNDVGGDFYDAFPYRGDGWMLVIGDVCGKGASAAAVTALARHTLRAAAMSGRTPAGMLAMLHDVLREQPSGRDLCTVCLVSVTFQGGRASLTVALAGHPRPLLVDANGHVEQLGSPGTLLGVIDPVEFRETSAALKPCQSLILYTDGVVEAGRPHDCLGEQGLIELCSANASAPLRVMLERMQQTASERADGRLRDDLALLALRLSSSPPR